MRKSLREMLSAYEHGMTPSGDTIERARRLLAEQHTCDIDVDKLMLAMQKVMSNKHYSVLYPEDADAIVTAYAELP